MEIYFKDFISNENSLEKLVDDLALVVQGADDFARAVGANVSERSRDEITSRVNRLKESYGRIKEKTMAGARATDQAVRRNPYRFLAAAVLLGAVMGIKLGRSKNRKIKLRI